MKSYDLLESLGGSWEPLRDLDEPMYIIMIESDIRNVSVPLNMSNRIAGVRKFGVQKIRPINIICIGDDSTTEEPLLRGTTCYTRPQVRQMLQKIVDVDIENLKVTAYQVTKDCVLGYHDDLKYSYILNSFKINYTDKRPFLTPKKKCV